MDKITTGKIKKFFKGKGFAGALCLSVVAIGISTYLTYDSTLKTIADEEPQKPDSTVSAEQVDNTQSGIPKDETSKSEADSSAAPANNFVRSTAKRVMPIENEVIWEYSNGELVKSETLGVWKTHDGILAEMGDISRFDDVKEIQKLSGLGLVACSSGKHKGETKISHRGRKRLRYWLFQAAKSAVAHSEEFKELHVYYTTRKQNPLKKMQSLIVIACKILRVIFTILTKGTAYDPKKLLGDIVRPDQSIPQAA